MHRILIVDDSPVIRLKLKQLCEKFSLTVAGEASNGEEAVKLYKLRKPELVLMDMNMPEMSGIEAVEEILSIDPNARILIISGDAKDFNVRQALLKGVKGYILKPIEETKLYNAIYKALE